MKKACFPIFLSAVLAVFLLSCKPTIPLPNIDITSDCIPRDHKIPCFIYYLENGDYLKEHAQVKWRGGISCARSEERRVGKEC